MFSFNTEAPKRKGKKGVLLGYLDGDQGSRGQFSDP